MCGAARVMPAMSAAQVHEKVAQPAEAVQTATPSQMSRDVPAAKEEKPITAGVSAGAAATATDEEGRTARKAAYLALLADESPPSFLIGCHEAPSAVFSGTAAEAVARCGMC
jgi:hypothetical protein